MYKGRNWEIILPRRDLRIYRPGDINLVRAPDVVRDAGFEAELQGFREEARKLCRPDVIVGFGGVSEDGVVEVNQLDYTDYIAMTLMRDRKGDVPRPYIGNYGLMSTVRTDDGKLIHSRRSDKVASWPNYDSLFGCGLTRGMVGTVDELVEAGASKLFSLAAQRVCTELGLREEYIERIRLMGIVEGRSYDDHIFAFDTRVNVESGRIMAEKPRILERVGKKYADIVDVDATERGLAAYLDERRAIEFVEGAIVLMGANLFGAHWPSNLSGVQRI